MVNGGTLLFHASPLRGERIFGRALARKVEVRRYSADTPNNPRQAGRSPDEGDFIKIPYLPPSTSRFRASRNSFLYKNPKCEPFDKAIRCFPVISLSLAI